MLSLFRLSTNRHLETLADRSYSIPAEFSGFSSYMYNVPEASNTSEKCWTALLLKLTHTCNFELLEKPWKSK